MVTLSRRDGVTVTLSPEVRSTVLWRGHAVVVTVVVMKVVFVVLLYGG